MKILKTAQNYFHGIQWTPRGQQKAYSTELNEVSSQFLFFGFHKMGGEATLMYKIKISVGLSGRYHLVTRNVSDRSISFNEIIDDVDTLKAKLNDMGVPLMSLGLAEADIHNEHKSFRLTHVQTDQSPPLEIILKIEPAQTQGKYSIPYVIKNLATGEQAITSQYISKDGAKEFDFKESEEISRKMLNTLVNKKGYVPPTHPDYINEGELPNAEGSSKKKYVQSQDYGGYFSGEAPDYQGSHIGSPSVDVSNLSQFGDVQRSVDLVNRFDSSLLKNIVYMFNFSKSGVYGVYVPALDRDVKTKELQKRLEDIGYKVVEEDGMLRAYPTQEEKDQQTIQNEIQKIYEDLESKGGSVLGLNINDTRNEMEQSFANLQEIVEPERHAELRNDLMIAHIASTMAHEATHAHGHEDEGIPTQVETKLLNYALEEIRTKYQIEGELGLKRGSTNNWYKTAQQAPFYPPSGSDLNGRYQQNQGNLEGDQWGMLQHQHANRAIEEMLGRQFVSWTPEDLDQEHDSYELQLRKYTRDDWKLTPDVIFDVLLRDGRLEDDTGYKGMEELLEDSRPKPLLRPLKHASKLQKHATVFGWHNNLEISDGSTIAGMSDRVMEWDDRDESFVEEEDWIKAQPRYNPTYDVKGFYYRWIEPRFKPQLWDDFTSDVSNTHPAKRFASRDDFGFICDSLKGVRTKILAGEYKSTRFICSEDMLLIIDKSVSGTEIQLDVFPLGELGHEEVYACWLSKGVRSDTIKVIEDAIKNNNVQLGNLMEKMFGCKSTLGQAVGEFMDSVKETCEEYDIQDVYAIGSYARELSFGDETPEVEELEFTSNNPTNCLKLGYLVAEALGQTPRVHKDKKCVFINYKGISVYFNGGKRIAPIEKLMNKSRMEDKSCIMHDICNKDFTLNMKTYHPCSGKITTLFGDAEKIETLFDPDKLIALNPFIMLRAIYLAVKLQLPIDKKLDKAISTYSHLLVDKYPVEVLQFAQRKIESCGKEEAQAFFKKYELNEILDFGE